MAGFKPNIYPIMYWGLLYGLVAGFALLALYFLSQFITILWFPVFLAGLVLGGYRNYQRQKRGAGAETATSPMEEFKSAAQDIAAATREMMQEQRGAKVDAPETKPAALTIPPAPAATPSSPTPDAAPLKPPPDSTPR